MARSIQSPIIQLGIDFGTTHTVISYCDRGNFPYLQFEDAEGEEHRAYPTLLAYPHKASHSFLDRSGIRFGLEAYQVRDDPNWVVFRDLKRLFLGTDKDLPTLLSKLYGAHSSVSSDSSHALFFKILCDFVSTLKKDICTQSTLSTLWDGPENLSVDDIIFEVALAFPAQAHSTQRFLTIEAFKQNGFKVNLALNEPTAVALDHLYAHQSKVSLSKKTASPQSKSSAKKTANPKKASSSKKSKKGSTSSSESLASSLSLSLSKEAEIVVFDLGGGTLDLSWVRQNQDGVEVLKSRGSNQIGGNAFDQTLVNLFVKPSLFKRLSKQAQSRLLEQARIQKESLRPQSRRVIFDFDLDLDPKDQARLKCKNLTPSVPINDYYDACTPLIEEAIDLLDALLEQSTLPSTVQHLYVTGGGSALPKVMRLLKEKYGRKVKRALSPFGSVATGLAVALFSPQLHYKESIARYFGVFREWDHGQQTAFDPLYAPQQSRLFASDDQNYTITRRYRPCHNIGFFRYIECDWLKEGRPEGVVSVRGDVYFPYDPVLQNTQTQSNPFTLSQMPIKELEQHRPLIEERYTLDQNGLLQISIHNLETEFSMKYTLQSPSNAS